MVLKLSLEPAQAPERALDNLCHVVNYPPKSAWALVEGVAEFKVWLAERRGFASWGDMLNARRDLWGEIQGFVLPPQFEPPTQDSAAGFKIAVKRPHQNIPHQHALWLLAHLVTNPLHTKFGGPCPRCRNVFVIKRRGDQRYCSRKCHSADTSRAAAKARYDALRKKRIEFVELARDEYAQQRRRPAGPWQKWVALKATERMRKHPLTRLEKAITPHFVIRNIAPPKGEQ